MLKEIAPSLKRIAIVQNPKTSALDYFLRAAQAAAPSLAIEIVASPVENTAADIERVLESLARVPDTGIVTPPDPTTIAHRDLLIALASRHRLPAISASGSSSSWVASCLTGPTRSICFGWRHPMSTASCAEITCRPASAGADSV
jgi:ABC-type uncharacterized transport system substrate-binding protein